MIDSYGRNIYQKALITPLLPFFSRISPSTITLFAVISGMIVCPMLAFQWSYSAFAFLMLSGFLDTLDGSVARFQNRTTPFGAAFDITGDRIVEFSVILGLYLFNPEARGLSCILMLGSILICVTSFLVVGIFTQNNTEKSFYYSPGLIERAEAFIFFGIMILFPSAFLIISSIFYVLVLFTALTRLYQLKQMFTP